MKVPDPAVLAPIDTKLAVPSAATFQLLSVIDTPVAEAPPIVIVSAPPLPRVIVSAPVEPKVTVVAELAVKEVPVKVPLSPVTFPLPSTLKTEEGVSI